MTQTRYNLTKVDIMNDKYILLEEHERRVSEALENLPRGHQWVRSDEPSDSRDDPTEQSETAEDKP